MVSPNDFNDIIDKIPGAKVSGNKVVAPCPLSGHTTPQGHLTITNAGDKALVTCQGGRHSYSDICRWFGYDSLSYSAGSNGNESNIVAAYNYTDSEGTLLYQVVRYYPKDFRQRRPGVDGNWIWNLKDVNQVLYCLPSVIKAVKEGLTVYICEGEKDVDNLVKLGLIATTNSGGAEKWRQDYSEVLKGASVIILPDKDAPGKKHAQKVAASLYGKARSIKIIELPDRDGQCIKDVSDWIAAGGTITELEQLVSQTLEYKLRDKNNTGLICIADVAPETVDWLWYPYIPKGKLTLFEGDPGVGKSWVSLAIATAVSLGKGLPEVEIKEPAGVLLASAEDGLGDTIRPRLDSMGADVKNIHAIKGALNFEQTGINTLGDYIEKIKPVLTIIDPLVAYIGAGVDIHRANETRAVMAKLAELAEQYSVAILAVRHLAKGGTSKPIYRGLGSIDIAAACRSVLMAGYDPDDPQKRAVVHIKSNLASMGCAIGYELREGGFYWTGESDLTWQRILSAEDIDNKSARDEAVDFIKSELSNGPVEASQIWRDAKEAGLAEATLKRAKFELGIITKRRGEAGRRGGGKFTWELPENNLKDQKGFRVSSICIQENDTLNNSSFENPLSLKTNDPLNILENMLSISVEKAIEIWNREGAPVIHLGPGENCLDLEKMLSNQNIKPEHLQVINNWLNERKGSYEG